MHYLPFRPENHASLLRELQKHLVDFATQRGLRNFRYKGEIVEFVLVFGLDREEARVELTEPFDASPYDERILKGLHFFVKNLIDADKADVDLSRQIIDTQFGVMQGFRFFNQNFGGNRYVSLCRDLIDTNMEGSLKPFMYEDLVSAIFLNYNKNTSRDVEGLLDGVMEFIHDINFNKEAQMRVFSLIGSKSNPAQYTRFAKKCLESADLSVAMRQLIVNSFTPAHFNYREVPPELSPEEIVSLLPQEDLIEIFKNAPGGLKNSVRQLFFALGKDCPDELVRAYLNNPSRDVSILGDIPRFPYLPGELKRIISNIHTFTPRTTIPEIVRYCASLEGDQTALEETYRSCDALGKGEVAKALRGESFIVAGMSLGDIAALWPYINKSSETMRNRLTAYLKHLMNHYVVGETLDGILLDLPLSYREVAELAINEDLFYSKNNLYIVAERFGYMNRLGFKEWRYHD